MKEKWAWACVWKTFTAGMRSTQLSENFHYLIGNASQHGTAYQQGAASQHGIAYQHGAASLHLNLSESENRIQQFNTLGMYNFF
jgi:hypothetical protein